MQNTLLFFLFSNLNFKIVTYKKMLWIKSFKLVNNSEFYKCHQKEKKKTTNNQPSLTVTGFGVAFCSGKQCSGGIMLFNTSKHHSS